MDAIQRIDPGSEIALLELIEKLEDSAVDQASYVHVPGSLAALIAAREQVSVAVREIFQTLASKEAELLRLREAIEEFDTQLTNWAKAYPLTVFPEPDMAKVHTMLQAEGMTLDAVSASNMRHVTSKLSELFEPVRALTTTPQPTE